MENKIALVTGAGSGIGKDAALGLAAENYHVILCGRTRSSLDNTQQLCPTPERMTISVADVNDPDSVRDLFEKIKQSHGRLDILFNNAGIGAAPVPFDELTDEQWTSVVGTNLNGAFFCAREAFGLMKRQDPQGGRIINNGSISAQTPRPNSAPYTATKHAISGLTKSISLDGRKHQICCSQIDIGNALTDMAEKMTKGIPQANGSIAIEPTMPVKHVTEAIIYIAGLPLSANVLFMTVMANGMPFVGRG